MLNFKIFCKKSNNFMLLLSALYLFRADISEINIYILVVGGSGPNTEKVVTLAEIIKRRNKNVHQMTKVGEKTVREFWDPKTEELDPLVVTRLVPTVHILLVMRREDEQKQAGFLDVLWGEEKKAGNGRKRKVKKSVKKEEDKLVKDVTKINLS